MATNIRKQSILGLSWRRLGHDDEENIPFKTPEKPSDVKVNKILMEKGTFRRSLRRMKSVREAFGTLRQKLRTSTHRRKPLRNASPYTPRHNAKPTGTPSSVQRRSARIAKKLEDQMLSPFTIDTPSKTPSKIRMGIHEPKRYGRYFEVNPLSQFNFSSPGRVVRDVNSLTKGIQALTEIGDQLNIASERRSGIRTTPKVRRTQKNPVFV